MRLITNVQMASISLSGAGKTASENINPTQQLNSTYKKLFNVTREKVRIEVSIRFR
jgi:hypothetical protein